MRTIVRASLLLLIVSFLLLTGLPGFGGPGNSGSADGPFSDLVVLIGDPHVHTSFSDGDESPDFALRYARDVSRLDWCCLTDHAEYLANGDPASLEYYRSLPVKYDQPGKFCVLFGYEWTNLYYGHRNVYSTDNSIPVLPSDKQPSRNIDSFWSLLREHDVITIPHHPMMPSQVNWWKYKNPGVETDVEFYSKWGMSLQDNDSRPLPDSNFANGIFRVLVGEGTRYGIMAGSDTHMSRPGSCLEESRQDSALPYAQSGLTGVWAESFTRDAIYDALKNRHCYGMTGTRVNLEFSVNGYIMGSELSSSTPPEMIVKVSSEVKIDTFELVRITRDGMIKLAVKYPGSTEYSGNFTDNLFPEGSSYLVRVYLENGDQAISSPVWVDRIPE